MTVRGSLTGTRQKFWLRACESVGCDLHLHGKPTVSSAGGPIRIGDRFRLASRPVASHLVVGPHGAIEIGDDVSIGHGAAIAAFERVAIGQGTHIGPFVIIMDTNFHGASNDQAVQHDCRPVVIGKHCRIGSRVTITRGAWIGDGAEILAGSVVSSAIPPEVCAGGARARIIGRPGEAASRWDSVAAALPELVMGALALDAPPDLVSSVHSTHLDEPGLTRLLAAIEGCFGVALDSAAIGRTGTLADLAAAVELVRSEHAVTAPRH